MADLRMYAIAILAACLLLFSFDARGGEWHAPDQVECNTCHTAHNSKGGVPARTDSNPNPAEYLLLRDNATDLCLSCHDGSRSDAPDVVAPVAYVMEPAGGFLAGSGIASPMGHDIGVASDQIPPGGNQALRLTCITCHDPHGNANYRNLRPDPTMTGRPEVMVEVRQAVIANGSNPAAVYVPSNLLDKTGISAWCNTCHDPEAPPTGSVSGHPVNRTIWGSVMADYTRWSGSIQNRVRSGNPIDDVVPSNDDQVICLSCHKAHGNDQPDGLIYADGQTLDSTCGECHSQ
jgi:hypothetical protein